jgi:hypothetical protein
MSAIVYSPNFFDHILSKAQVVGRGTIPYFKSGMHQTKNKEAKQKDGAPWWGQEKNIFKATSYREFQIIQFRHLDLNSVEWI